MGRSSPGERRCLARDDGASRPGATWRSSAGPGHAPRLTGASRRNIPPPSWDTPLGRRGAPPPGSGDDRCLVTRKAGGRAGRVSRGRLTGEDEEFVLEDPGLEPHPSPTLCPPPRARS